MDKHIMFDDPELVARRKRQANLGDSVAKAAFKQSRAVRFQQPLPDDTSPDAQAEEEPLFEHAEEERLPAETPHNALTHPLLLPDSAGSGLNLTLSNSAAQRGTSRDMLDEEEEEGNQAEQSKGASMVPVLPVVSQPLAPPLAPPLHPPDTTGKLLVNSKNSLEEAQSIAQGILGSASAVAAIDAEALPARSTGNIGANIAVASPAASAAKKLPALSQQRGEHHALHESPLPSGFARDANPANGVLASTTRPNVPSKVGGKPAQLKSAPASTLRLADAGHTPHPLKSRMVPVDSQPNASPQGSVGVVGGPRGGPKDPEGATPAATLRPFGGATPYPSRNPGSNSMPVDDTPMVGSDAVQHQIAPDSCVGQVSSETSLETKSLWREHRCLHVSLTVGSRHQQGLVCLEKQCCSRPTKPCCCLQQPCFFPRLHCQLTLRV